MQDLDIVKKGKKWEVIYLDENGVSTLDETSSFPQAAKSLEKFYKQMLKGVLLKPTRRVAGWEDYQKKRLKKMV
jgi:hypothetical protein